MANYKPQSPLIINNNGIYPLTTHDQIIMEDGTRSLTSLISQKATTARYSVTLSSSGWSSSAPYTQTVNVSGILATDDPFVDVDMSGATTTAQGMALIEAWGLLGRITANAGSITAYCYEEKPTVNIPIILKVVR